MSSIFAILVLGLALGMRHATDPDHVIAIGTIVSRQRNPAKAALIGAAWGFGHTITLFVVGSAMILFKVVVPTRLGLAMELSVGLMLMALGVLNLTGVLPRFMARRTPTHAPGPASGGHGSLGLFHWLRPLVVGLVHGLAGSAAVALLVMATMQDPWAEIGYLLLFGFGTVLGMMTITTLISLPAVFAGAHFARWNRAFATASGVLSLCFGVYLCLKTGIGGGLLSANPHWTPE